MQEWPYFPYALQWLPVCYRIDFKVLLFVFKLLNELALFCLSKLLHLHTPTRALRTLLVVPRSRLKLRGGHTFTVTAPELWNILALHIRTAPTGDTFKSWLLNLAVISSFYSLLSVFLLYSSWFFCVFLFYIYLSNSYNAVQQCPLF